MVFWRFKIFLHVHSFQRYLLLPVCLLWQSRVVNRPTQCNICMDLGALQIAAIFSIVLFLVDIYGAKGIIAVLLDIFLFLSYSVIYSYVFFLMRLIEIIKTLILLFILLHLYGVAITRLAEGCTPLLWPQLLLLPVL